MSVFFRLTDAQMARFEPFFPKPHRKPCVHCLAWRSRARDLFNLGTVVWSGSQATRISVAAPQLLSRQKEYSPAPKAG